MAASRVQAIGLLWGLRSQHNPYAPQLPCKRKRGSPREVWNVRWALLSDWGNASHPGVDTNSWSDLLALFSWVNLLPADSISDLTDPGPGGGPWKSCWVSRLEGRRGRPNVLRPALCPLFLFEELRILICEALVKAAPLNYIQWEDTRTLTTKLPTRSWCNTGKGFPHERSFSSQWEEESKSQSYRLFHLQPGTWGEWRLGEGWALFEFQLTILVEWENNDTITTAAALTTNNNNYS